MTEAFTSTQRLIRPINNWQRIQQNYFFGFSNRIPDKPVIRKRFSWASEREVQMWDNLGFWVAGIGKGCNNIPLLHSIIGSRSIRNLKCILRSPFFVLDFSMEGIDLVKISQRYSLILKIASSDYPGSISKSLNFSGWQKKYTRISMRSKRFDRHGICIFRSSIFCEIILSHLK